MHVIPETPEAEAGGLQVQSLGKLQSGFKSSLGNLEQPNKT